MTSDLTSAPTDLTLDWVQTILTKSAKDVGLLVEPFSQLTLAVFRGGESAAAAKMDVGDLPATARGFRVGRYSVILGLLPEIPSTEAVAESLRRYRNQCVIARSYLTANEVLDLQLFLIGPRDSERSEKWQPLALSAEKDDRVSRKLIWLRPEDPADYEVSFSEFLKRTFLARPWIHKKIFTMAALDSLSKATTFDKSSNDTLGEWIKLALDKEIDPTVLVDALVDTWAKRGQL